MRTIRRIAARRTSACFLLGLVSLWAAAQDSAVNSQLALTFFAIQGTNLTILGVVPPGLGQVTLEIRPTLIAPWEAAGVVNVPAGGGYDYELEIGFGR